jgi:hypothetical protein
MPQVGFEPAIPVFERAKTFYALNRATTVIVIVRITISEIILIYGTQKFLVLDALKVRWFGHVEFLNSASLLFRLHGRIVYLRYPTMEYWFLHPRIINGVEVY